MADLETFDDAKNGERPKAPFVKTSKKSEGKVPKPLEESELKSIKKEYEASKEYQKMDNRLENWHTNKEYLNCRWQDENDDEITAVNSLWSNAQTELPQLYFRNPMVTLTAESDYFPIKIGGNEYQVDNIQASKLFQIRLNNVVKNMRVESVWERIIMDSLAPYGYGVGKVGYALQTESDWTNEYDRTSYWFRWVDPRNITFDLFADDFTGLSGSFETIVRLRPDLLRNPNYDKKMVKEMRKADAADKSLPAGLKERLNRAGKDFSPDLVAFVEYHDMKGKCIRWLDLEGTPQEIRAPVKRDRWFEGSDYIFLSLNIPTDDTIYPLSDVEPVLDQAISRNKTRTAIEGHVRNWGQTIYYPEGTLTDELIGQIKTIKDRLFVPLPREMFAAGGPRVQNPPSVPPDWYRLDEMDRRDNSETLGLPDYMMGGPKKTATHDMLSSNAFTTRINRRRRKIQISILEMFRKVSGFLQEYDRGETSVVVAEHVEDKAFVEFLQKMAKQKGGTFDPKRPFVGVSKEWWQGEYGFDYEVEEQLDRPKAVQIQQLNNTVTAITANPFLSRALYEDPQTPKKIVSRMFDLQGMKIAELKTRANVVGIPATVENEMVEMGDPSHGVEARDLQVPMPSELDNDAEHIVTHYRLMREMQEKVQPLALKEPKSPLEMMTLDFLNKSIAKLQKHMMLHDLQSKQKDEKDTMAFGPQGSQGMPGGPNASGPMGPQMPQEEATPNQGQLMGSGNTMV